MIDKARLWKIERREQDALIPFFLDHMIKAKIFVLATDRNKVMDRKLKVSYPN